MVLKSKKRELRLLQRQENFEKLIDELQRAGKPTKGYKRPGSSKK
jgi:hypothetical protein